MNKACQKCNTSKEVSSFHKNKRTRDGYHNWCKECHNEYYSVWYQERGYQANKDFYKRKAKKNNYGIELDTYDEMMDEQLGLCAICQSASNNYKDGLVVDHNHITKEVRRLLCPPCNRLLGQAEENIEILESAINYLKKFNQ